MTDSLALTAPGKRRRAGHRAALCVSIDVDGPYGELSNRPPSNRYDISQTDDDPAGVDRLVRLLADVDVRGTFCWVGRAAEDQPGPGRRTVAGGHEIALHGWDHRGYRSMSPAEQRDDLLQSAATLLDVSGTIPVGHKTASWSFDETTHALPPVVNLPPAMTYDDDTLFEDKMVTPQATYEFWREDVDVLRADGGLMCLTLHPFVTGRPGPSRALARLLDYAVHLGDVWIARADEIARWWRTRSGVAEPVDRLSFTQEL